MSSSYRCAAWLAAIFIGAPRSGAPILVQIGVPRAGSIYGHTYTRSVRGRAEKPSIHQSINPPPTIARYYRRYYVTDSAFQFAPVHQRRASCACTPYVIPAHPQQWLPIPSPKDSAAANAAAVEAAAVAAAAACAFGTQNPTARLAHRGS